MPLFETISSLLATNSLSSHVSVVASSAAVQSANVTINAGSSAKSRGQVVLLPKDSDSSKLTHDELWNGIEKRWSDLYDPDCGADCCNNNDEAAPPAKCPPCPKQPDCPKQPPCPAPPKCPPPSNCPKQPSCPPCPQPKPAKCDNVTMKCPKPVCEKKPCPPCTMTLVSFEMLNPVGVDDPRGKNNNMQVADYQAALAKAKKAKN